VYKAYAELSRRTVNATYVWAEPLHGLLFKAWV